MKALEDVIKYLNEEDGQVAVGIYVIINNGANLLC